MVLPPPGILLLLLALLLSGCATQTEAVRRDANLPRRVELPSTPFFAQERYQCGPAALAMVLAAAGIAVVPDELISQVYVPEREGSLPPEMLAAARRNGALAMTIGSRLADLLAEVSAGNPVLVLQNLSLPIFPLWHYAVVIGFDLDKGELLLRSGTTERLVMPMSTFEHTWGRSNFWGMMALPPSRLPVTADENDMVSALVAYEKVTIPERARIAYDAARQRWQHNLTLQLGSGNAAYAAGDRRGALMAFRAAALDHPDSAPAFNNLASVLAELGQLDEARLAAQKAVALGGPWRDTAAATLARIEAQQTLKKRP
ncbi:MAG TPA: PA2778 family cysteine peptidase [Burkholderiaceae bacterium]|nr:PA2778 family cysteine peptidase [Burkholderiaceae bacterium]